MPAFGRLLVGRGESPDVRRSRLPWSPGSRMKLRHTGDPDCPAGTVGKAAIMTTHSRQAGQVAQWGGPAANRKSYCWSILGEIEHILATGLVYILSVREIECAGKCLVGFGRQHLVHVDRHAVPSI